MGSAVLTLSSSEHGTDETLIAGGWWLGEERGSITETVDTGEMSSAVAGGH